MPRSNMRHWPWARPDPAQGTQTKKHPMRNISPKPLVILSLCLVAASGSPAISMASSEPVAAVTGGEIRGRLLENGRGAVFRGIPFAHPPVGEYRWREPMPVVPWQGIRDAYLPGPPAPQLPLGWNDQAAAASREDCLYLDVWTPTGTSADRNPVMVWIHGGANVAGAGGFDPLYDGRALIGRGVVLVVVEYRLGILGFFSHPELTRESHHHASGNYAILDQIAALRWVRENISKFGGDSANVTVFGQSAGATDILALMASPLSKGLFRRAIAESPKPWPQTTRTLPEAEREGAQAAGDLNAPARDTLAFLRTLAPDALLKSKHVFGTFTADGWVFPLAPVDAWSTGREHRVPLIVGSNGVEFPVLESREALRGEISAFFGDLAPRALALYGLSGNGPAAPPDPVYGDASDQWGSDLFRCPSVVHGAWHSETGNPVWEYEFDRAIPPNSKVSHSSELSYVFGNLYSSGSQAGAFVEADRRLSGVIQAYWTNFARTGSPNGPGLAQWPGYDARGRSYLAFTEAAEEVAMRDQRGPFCDLFRELMSKPEGAR
jgi:para-nitrobenzyl esterase